MFDIAIGPDHYLYDDAMVLPKTELPPTLIVYRGADPSHALGSAWTTCPEVARRFAYALDDQDGYRRGNIYNLTVGPERVLARFFYRNEFEVVVNTTELGDDDFEIFEGNWKYRSTMELPYCLFATQR